MGWPVSWGWRIDVGKRLYMGTTVISAAKTLANINELLSQAGAVRIMQTYDGFGGVTGLTFALDIDGQQWPFSVPARIEPVFEILQSKRPPRTREKNEERDRQQAVRVAWRMILRWLEAQIALIETGMVKTQEVFLPYLRVKGGQTMFEVIEAKGPKALPMVI